MLLIAVYMPYKNYSCKDISRHEKCLSLLSIIEDLSSQHQDCSVIVGGDFKVDFVHLELPYKVHDKFCEETNLQPVVSHKLC